MRRATRRFLRECIIGISACTFGGDPADRLWMAYEELLIDLYHRLERRAMRTFLVPFRAAVD